MYLLFHSSLPSFWRNYYFDICVYYFLVFSSSFYYEIYRKCPTNKTWRERKEEKDREKHCFAVPLFYAFIG